MDQRDDSGETDEARRQRHAAELDAFNETVNELMAGLDRQHVEGLSALERPNGVRIPPGVWDTVRRGIGDARLTELLEQDRPALIALLRETWRAQRQAEELRG